MAAQFGKKTNTNSIFRMAQAELLVVVDKPSLNDPSVSAFKDNVEVTATKNKQPVMENGVEKKVTLSQVEPMRFVGKDMNGPNADASYVDPYCKSSVIKDAKGNPAKDELGNTKYNHIMLINPEVKNALKDMAIELKNDIVINGKNAKGEDKTYTPLKKGTMVAFGQFPIQVTNKTGEFKNFINWTTGPAEGQGGMSQEDRAKQVVNYKDKLSYDQIEGLITQHFENHINAMNNKYEKNIEAKEQRIANAQERSEKTSKAFEESTLKAAEKFANKTAPTTPAVETPDIADDGDREPGE